MRDVSGRWTITLTPTAAIELKPGQTTIPRGTTLAATLEQQPSNNLLGFGALVWGALVSDDKGFFDALQIPRLMMNDGSKTGAALGCRVTLNVPTAATVSDDDVPQLPNRISLVGRVKGFGVMVSEPLQSTVIMVEDGTMTERTFEWTATFGEALDGGVLDGAASDLRPPTYGRKPPPKRKKGKGEPDPPIKGPVSLHLVGIEPDRRRVVFEVRGLGRPPKANYITFVDERGRRFVGVGVDCQEPEGTTRRCEIELPPGYEKRKITGIEMHLRGLHGPTVKVSAEELSGAQEGAPAGSE